MIPIREAPPPGARACIEVEPLGDARWSRIEQSLMQRLEELPPAPRAIAPKPAKRLTPRVVAFASSAAFAMVAAIALLIARPWWSASSGPSASSSSFASSASSRAAAPSRVATEASPSHVTIGDASIDLSPESGIVVREEEHATVLVLERGEVALHIAPRPKDRPFLVEAGEVHVRVVGTEFSVRRAGVSAVVTVRKGVVEVTARGEVARLTAGGAWPDEGVASAVGASGAPLSVSPALPNGATLAAGPAAAPATPWTSTPGTTPAVVTTPHPSAVLRRSASGHRASRHSDATAVAGAAPSEPTPAAPPPDEAMPAPPALAVAPPQSAQDAVTPAPTEPSAQARYEAAERIERKDPDGALRAYTALARGDDAWAQDALFAAGRLQADRGARSDAIRLLEEYLRRFPRGSNAQDARTLRDRIR
jgi:hypothetical protein